ncbi:MAG: DegT/DnrJ/EryC1/StrS family aminotransferase, partial [Gemmatimonadota bacterium]|nr:DegT/DnrJ/EryC1/StrS family aminotransferase [Gemmatimonadota bacterium]
MSVDLPAPAVRRGLRHQLAVYSPLPLAALSGAVSETLRGADGRARLRDLLRQEFAADEVLLCGSGTEALQLAIRAAAEQVGGAPPVAIPAFSCFDVAAAAVATGAPLALYDVDPQTLAPDPASLERALEGGARVVVASPLYGVPIDWEAVDGLAAFHGAVVIEDAAQGHGTVRSSTSATAIPGGIRRGRTGPAPPAGARFVRGRGTWRSPRPGT